MLKNAQVGALGTKIYVCGGTDDSWTAHATVEVGFSITMMKIMIMKQRKAKSIIFLFSVSTQALDTITGLWQTLPDLLVPRLITPWYHLAHLGYHGLSTLLILLILIINVLWQTLPDLLVPRLITPYYHLAHLGYHGLSTLVILITLLILLINVLWQTLPDLLVPRLIITPYYLGQLDQTGHLGHLIHLDHLDHLGHLGQSPWSPGSSWLSCSVHLGHLDHLADLVCIHQSPASCCRLWGQAVCAWRQKQQQGRNFKFHKFSNHLTRILQWWPSDSLYRMR